MKFVFILLLVTLLLIQISAKKKFKRLGKVATKSKNRVDVVSGSDSNGGSDNIDNDFDISDKDNNFQHRKKLGIDMRGTFNKQFAVSAAYRQPEMNLVCSPLSGYLPLGKLALGATPGSKTLNELLKAIGAESRFDVADLFSRLIGKMVSLPGVTLNLATRLYISTKYEIQSKFHSEARAIFKSSCERVNFDDATGAARTINNWVSSETQGKISQILRPDQVSPNAGIMLVNAVYFLGRWMYPFPSAMTRVENFNSPSGYKKVMMMTQTRVVPYYKSSFLNAQLVELPYKQGKASMVIILPNRHNGLKELLSAIKLSPEALNKAYKKMVRRLVQIKLPRFKAESTLDLNILYGIVGIKALFLEGGIGEIVKNQMLRVSLAIQKAVIEVDEGGTEAASVTGQMLKIKEVKASHPFMFLVIAEGKQLIVGTYNGNNNDL